MLFISASSLLFTIIYRHIWTIWNKKKFPYQDRIHRISIRRRAQDGANLNEGEFKEKTESFGKRMLVIVGKRFEGKAYVEKWGTYLEQSNIPLKPEEFFALRVFVGIGAFLIAYILGNNIWIMLSAFTFGFLSLKVYLNRRREIRMGRVRFQLPTALGTMTTALRAGFSFMQAVQLISKEIPDPMGPEFGKTIRELNLGVSAEKAFDNLLKRLPDKDLEIVITALLVQRSTGGNLAEILDSIQETVRERIRMKEELRTLTAQGRISAWIITGLPVILGFMFHLINPEYFSPMIQHPLGWVMLGVGLVSGMIGWFTIQKIINIEV
jgi:tight adherence protein B